MQTITLESLIGLRSKIEELPKQIFSEFFSYIATKNRNQGSFYQHRPYQPGDSVKQINWSVTARMNEPWVKETEYDDLITNIVIFLDLSASMSFSSSYFPKYVISIELMAILGWLCIEKKCTFQSILIFDDHIVDLGVVTHAAKFINHLTQVIDLSHHLAFCSSLKWKQKRLEQMMQMKSIFNAKIPIFVISDFIPFTKELRALCINHAYLKMLYGICVIDQMEQGSWTKLPALVTNTNHTVILRTQTQNKLSMLKKECLKHRKQVEQWFDLHGLQFLTLNTRQNAFTQLLKTCSKYLGTNYG